MVTVKDILSIVIENEIKIDFQNFDYSEPLSEQGMDSLDITSVLFTLEERFHIKIREEDIKNNKLSSINNIVTYINEIKK